MKSSDPLSNDDSVSSRTLGGETIEPEAAHSSDTPAAIATSPPNLAPPRPQLKLPSRKLLLLCGLSLGLVALGTTGYNWWQFMASHEETDDAYVTTDIHPVSSRVAGTVLRVAAIDNQTVGSGNVLVQLDPRDFQVALQQAEAALRVAQEQARVAQANINVTSTSAAGQTTQAEGNIDAAIAAVATAQAAVNEAKAGVSASKAQLAAVEANLAKAKLDFQRYQTLVGQGAIPRTQYDAAKATYDALVAQRQAAQEQLHQSQAKVAQAQENLRNAQAKVAATRGTLTQANAAGQQTKVNQQQYQAALAAVAQAQAQVNNARLQLSYTTIIAPAQGVISNKTVQVGQRIQPGQMLMAVATPKPWVVANFKETQVGEIQPGQEVEIKVDAFPNRVFRGKVDSLAPASGAKFALLPPDNATGNFTKIVQRLPVKVVFDPVSIRGYESRIAAGMSVVVSVSTVTDQPPQRVATQEK